QPTEEDFKRTPLLVSHNRVSGALEWLKLNHQDYHDIDISYENIRSYPETSPPVTVSYHKETDNKEELSKSLHDTGEEEGSTSRPCPLVVHGVTGSQLHTQTMKSLKATALKHLLSGGKIMAVGHAENPESLYNNPHLYPQMFPWLFPYGLGGIGNTNYYKKISETAHKHCLLMYYDK
ncbi:hypothetical protein OE88DRAFT_1608444, partial [Heliocybe sulcata]